MAESSAPETTDVLLERVLAEDYLGNVGALSTDDIRQRRAECHNAETQLSYVRRLVQGRLDITASELDRRRSGGSPEAVDELIARLPDILADRTRSGGPSRLPAELEPGEVTGRLVDELDAIDVTGHLDDPAAASDDELAELTTRLEALEHDVSPLRRALFDRIDTLGAELSRRYQTGEATVDSLL